MSDKASIPTQDAAGRLGTAPATTVTGGAPGAMSKGVPVELKELMERSPLRTFEKAIGGELGPGQIGIVIARHGAGKTPFVVGMALDAILRGKKLLHVSLDMKTEHVREFYDQIFAEYVRIAHLQDTLQLHLDMERARRIHAYLAASFGLEKFKTAVSFMRDHASFTPDIIVVDEYDFAHASAADLAGIAEVASEAKAALWMTAVRHREEPITDPDGIPAPVATHKARATAIIDLHTADQGVKVRLLKPAGYGTDGTLPFVLDPTSMLMKRA